MTDSMDVQEENGAVPVLNNHKMIYNVEENTPWHLSLLLGFQNCLLVFGSSITVPLILSDSFCMNQDKVAVSQLIGTTFFVTGLTTLLQTTLGIRLPIVQGCSASFLTQAVLLMKQTECPNIATASEDHIGIMSNDTKSILPGSDAHREIWMTRIREVQGGIIVSSVFEVAVGFSGTIGLMLRYVGPLTIAPTLTLIGLSLYPIASEMASQHWWIALTAIFLFILSSQYLKDVSIPCPGLSKICATKTLPLFGLFPILIAIFGTWAICAVLTAASVLPDQPRQWGYAARTDTGIDVLQNASWFRFPYPGQWGMPTFTADGMLSMLIAVFVTMIEALGNFYACAKISDAPSPPKKALNRGILVQGLCCLLAGIWGTGNGTTTASDNLSIVGLTKVASISVVQTGAVLLAVLGCFGKFSALFSTIPTPIIGGILMTVFGIITAVGLSFLQYVNLNSFRNIFILGFSLFFGAGVSSWVLQHNDAIKTGSEFVDQVLRVLLSTGMFVGAVTAFILDNTIPGTPAERGIRLWRTFDLEKENNLSETKRLGLYDLPVVTEYMKRFRIFKYIPFCFISQWPTETPKEENTHNLNNTDITVSRETVISVIENVRL